MVPTRVTDSEKYGNFESNNNRTMP